VPIAIAVLFGRRPKRGDDNPTEEAPVSWPAWWSAACLAVPPVVYMAIAMAGNLNLGLRHVLPVYPFAFIAIGLAISAAWVRWRATAVILPLVFATLALESLSAFPNFIPFFNPVFASQRLELLSDSNQDWGQDLPLLAKWQREHPDVTLYLAYFGTADPAYYGIKYLNLPGGYEFGPKKQFPQGHGVWAVSATALQAVYNPRYREVYHELQKHKPLAVLGNSIYLYDVSLPPGSAATAATAPASQAAP
jgi:hypothetical protein